MKSFINTAMIICLAVVVAPVCYAQGTTDVMQGKKVQEGAEQSQKAATVFKEIMNNPDRAVPQKFIADAKCIAVFPQVIKGGFIVGGRGGRGVASCRLSGGGWSAPAYFSMKGGSFGLQIGAEATDFVLLFMSDKAMDSLLKSKFTLGGEMSVAAGPVGREAGTESAQVLSYSRSKGAFAGMELKETSIAPEKDMIKDVYGENMTAEQVLKSVNDRAPSEVRAYPEALSTISTTKSARK